MKQWTLDRVNQLGRVLLRLDPDTLMRLRGLQGQLIAVHVTDFNYHFCVKVDETGLIVLADAPDVVGATITGSSVALFATGVSRGRPSALVRHPVSFSGDIALGEKIQSILRNIDLDWQELLAQLVGDSLGQALSWRFKQAANTLRQMTKTVIETTRHYAYYEAQYVPSPQEVTVFYQDVANLRDAVARAEARLAQLMSLSLLD